MSNLNSYILKGQKFVILCICILWRYILYLYNIYVTNLHYVRWTLVPTGWAFITASCYSIGDCNCFENNYAIICS